LSGGEFYWFNKKRDLENQLDAEGGGFSEFDGKRKGEKGAIFENPFTVMGLGEHGTWIFRGKGGAWEKKKSQGYCGTG